MNRRLVDRKQTNIIGETIQVQSLAYDWNIDNSILTLAVSFKSANPTWEILLYWFALFSGVICYFDVCYFFHVFIFVFLRVIENVWSFYFFFIRGFNPLPLKNVTAAILSMLYRIHRRARVNCGKSVPMHAVIKLTESVPRSRSKETSVLNLQSPKKWPPGFQRFDV